MAAKGTAAKSASGASMSKYDVEVERRLKAVEADVASISVSVANIERTLGELRTVDDLAETPPIPEGLEARFDNLIAVLSTKFGGIKGV
jgi:hypothetical protein